MKFKKYDATGDKFGRMRATKISVGYIWPCQRIDVREWKAKFLTRYHFIFRSYETEIFGMILYVPKWGVVPCFSPLNFRETFKGQYYLIGLLKLSKPSNNRILDASALYVRCDLFSVVEVVGTLAALGVVVRFCDSCGLKRLSTHFDFWCSRRCRSCLSCHVTFGWKWSTFCGRRLSFFWMVYACRCYASLDV